MRAVRVCDWEAGSNDGDDAVVKAVRKMGMNNFILG